jgi:SsrA-binding protein
MAKEKSHSADGIKVVATNRRARHEYEILETFEAGLELTGTEVKSLRGGGVSIMEAFAMPQGSDLMLLNMRISPYAQGNRFNHVPERPRRLLLHRQEINRLSGMVSQKGLTLVPLRVFFKRSWAKVDIGVCRGKKLHDKRHAIKERDLRRTQEREYRLR